MFNNFASKINLTLCKAYTGISCQQKKLEVLTKADVAVMHVTSFGLLLAFRFGKRSESSLNQIGTRSLMDTSCCSR